MIKYPASAVKPDLGLQAQSLSKRPKSYTSSLKNFKTNYWDIMCIQGFVRNLIYLRDSS